MLGAPGESVQRINRQETVNEARFGRRRSNKTGLSNECGLAKSKPRSDPIPKPTWVKQLPLAQRWP
jgi:hypothetical protein